MEATNAELQAKLALATEALRKSEERALVGQFALEVMHEIRNPLDALGYLIHLASEEASDPDKVREYLEQAKEQMAIVASGCRANPWLRPDRPDSKEHGPGRLG